MLMSSGLTLFQSFKKICGKESINSFFHRYHLLIGHWANHFYLTFEIPSSTKINVTLCLSDFPSANLNSDLSTSIAFTTVLYSNSSPVTAFSTNPEPTQFSTSMYLCNRPVHGRSRSRSPLNINSVQIRRELLMSPKLIWYLSSFSTLALFISKGTLSML
jgi:hypothetical protein